MTIHTDAARQATTTATETTQTTPLILPSHGGSVQLARASARGSRASGAESAPLAA